MQKSFVMNLKGKIEDGIVEIYKQLTGSRFPFDEQDFRTRLEPIIEHGNNLLLFMAQQLEQALIDLQDYMKSIYRH